MRQPLLFIFKKNYFAGFSASAVFVDEQQAFLSVVAQAFLSFSLQAAVASFFFTSLVEAVTVEVANPMVKATAKIIANFFMLSNF